MKYRDQHIALLRTFAVLLQRGEDVVTETHAWVGSEHGRYKVTFSADDIPFWLLYNELHVEQVKKDGEAWLRSQGRRR